MPYITTKAKNFFTIAYHVTNRKKYVDVSNNDSFFSHSD